MSEYSKIRLKNYFRTFVYMSLCGLLFLIGGGAFFIYESIAMNNSKPPGHKEPEERKMQDNGKHLFVHNHEEVRHTSFDYVSHSKTLYASEFRIVGFIFIGVGTLFICIGLPLAYQFWKRYQAAKDIERCPMLDPDYSEKLRKAYSGSRQGRVGLKRQRTTEKDQRHNKDSTSLVGRSNKNFWDFGRKSDVTGDSFRLAAHHHPSFNLVPIEGLAALSRDEMEAFSRFSDIESEEESEKTFDTSIQSTTNHSSPTSSKKMKYKKSRGFFDKLFGITYDVNQDVTLQDGVKNLAVIEDESFLENNLEQEQSTTYAEVTVNLPSEEELTLR